MSRRHPATFKDGAAIATRSESAYGFDVRRRRRQILIRSLLSVAALSSAACGSTGAYELTLKEDQPSGEVLEQHWTGAPSALGRDDTASRGSGLKVFLPAVAPEEARGTESAILRNLQILPGSQLLEISARRADGSDWTGNITLEVSKLSFTSHPDSPVQLSGDLKDGTLRHQDGRRLFAEGSLSVAANCLPEADPTPALCGTRPFLNLLDREARLEAGWLEGLGASACPAELVDLFVDGETILFSEERMQSGEAEPIPCIRTAAGQDEWPVFHCSTSRSGVEAEGCLWEVHALALPSQGGERAELRVMGFPEASDTCQALSCATVYPEDRR